MKALTTTCLIVLLVCAGATRLEAQAMATSFDQLRVLVAPGDKITVMDSMGREADGRIGLLTPERLTLITPAGPRELREGDITQIRQRRDDSLGNGALIGAAAGVGYGVAMLAVGYAISDGGAPVPAGVVLCMVIFGGVGAAAGAGVDALITSRQVIYRKSSAAHRLSVAPLLGAGRRGLGVTLRF